MVDDVLARYAPRLASLPERAAAEVSVHDSSRVEWKVHVPLPPRGATTRYAIDVEIEVPSQAFTPHEPWSHLQSLCRLDGPTTDVSADTSVREQRILANAADNLERAASGFRRHLAELTDATNSASLDEQAAALSIWINVARETVVRARTLGDTLALGADRVSPRLGDDYLGTQLLAFITTAMRAIDEAGPRGKPAAAALEPVERGLSELLAKEIAHRTEHGYLCSDGGPDSMEALVEHASRLKKHFQGSLFLRIESFQTAERFHNWLSVIVAIVASTWAILWQVFLTRQASGPSLRLGSGLLTLIIVGGAIYAIKDRIKEVGRKWLSSRIHRLYGQRVVRYSLPDPPRRIGTARESIEILSRMVPDSLEDERAASVAQMVIRFRHHGELLAVDVAAGAGGVRHLFRYDLSPLLSRLHDAEKPLVVLDPESHAARLRNAPRSYRLPVRLSVRGASPIEERFVLVVDKRGLRRVERRAISRALAGG